MENDVLREVIEVEKEIQLSLEQARQAAHLWLEARKKELEEEFAGKEKELQDSFEQSRERARRDAANKAADVLHQEEHQAEQWGRLSDDVLAGIVATHITKILPG
jgi:vacuolar-type H+-ATPase subunit H